MVTYLQGEGVIRGVEDGLRLLLHPVLHDHLSHLRYAFHLGVHRADDGLFPLVQLVTHQSEAKWRTQTSVNGFSRGRRRAGVSKAGAEGRPHSDPSFAALGLALVLLSCKTGSMVTPTSRGCCEDEFRSACELLGIASGTQRSLNCRPNASL